MGGGLESLNSYIVDALDPPKGSFEGQRDENTDAVSFDVHILRQADPGSGLDNAGKTTIVKQTMREDVSTVSPTLGFIIRTIDYQG